MQFNAHKNQQSSLAKLESTENPATHPARTHTHTETSAAPSLVLRNNGSAVHLQREQECAVRATLPYKDQPHTGGKQGKSRWAKVQLPPSEKRWGGLAAPRAAGLTTRGKWPWLGEFSEPWANGSLNQAKRVPSLLKIRVRGYWGLFQSPLLPSAERRQDKRPPLLPAATEHNRRFRLKNSIWRNMCRLLQGKVNFLKTSLAIITMCNPESFVVTLVTKTGRKKITPSFLHSEKKSAKGTKRKLFSRVA